MRGGSKYDMPGGVVESLEANERELVHVGKAAL